MRTPRIGQYLQESLAPSTHRAYASDLRRFQKWGGRIPATTQLVVRYLSAHAGVLSAATLNRHVASIARAHTVRGLKTPFDSKLVRSTLRGIRRVHGSAQTPAKPLMFNDLRKLVVSQPVFCRLRNVRDRALLLLGFAGGFRRSELSSLVCSDLSFNAKGVVVRLRASKTDPSRKGRDVAIPYARASVCPVRALKAWLQVSEAEQDDSPLFRRIDRHGTILDSALSGGAVGYLLKERMKAAGMDPTGYLLCASAVDGSLSTTVIPTSIRVVCANTLHATVNGAEGGIRIPHSTVFDAKKVRARLWDFHTASASTAAQFLHIYRQAQNRPGLNSGKIVIGRFDDERVAGELEVWVSTRSSPRIFIHTISREYCPGEGASLAPGNGFRAALDGDFGQPTEVRPAQEIARIRKQADALEKIHSPGIQKLAPHQRPAANQMLGTLLYGHEVMISELRQLPPSTVVALRWPDKQGSELEYQQSFGKRCLGDTPLMYVKNRFDEGVAQSLRPR